MMKEKAIPTKVKGTVLFTVVSVMMVLIVFLMGTLALATTASNRSYRTYQKAQTEANARAVLESVIKAVNDDDPSNTSGLKAQFGGLPMGGSFDIDVTGDGIDTVVTVKKIETIDTYDVTSQAWGSGNVYEVSTEIEMQSTGVSSTYVAYLTDSEELAASPPRRTTGGGGAFVSMGGTGDVSIGTGGFTGGGTTINLDGRATDKLTFMNDCTMEAPVYLNGTPNFNAFTAIYFNGVGSGQYFAVEGDLTMTNMFDLYVADPFTWESTADYTQIPTIYVGGTLKQTDSKMAFNTELKGSAQKRMAMNVYCGNIMSATNGTLLSMVGDLYCFDENATSRLTTPNDTTVLYNWTRTNIIQPDGSAKDNEFGNFYSKGNVDWMGFQVPGDIRVEKNMTVYREYGGNVCNSAVKANDIVVGGTLEIKSNARVECANVYADTLVLDGQLTCSGVVKVNRILGGGTISALNVEHLAGSTVVTTVWYTDVVTELNSGVEVPEHPEYQATVYTYKYSAKKHTIVTEDGTETSNTEEDVSYTKTVDIFPWSPYHTVEEYLNGNNDPLYNEVMNSTAAAPKVASMSSINLDGVPNTVITSATTVETKYGKKIYPDGYSKDEIRANVLEVPASSSYNFPTTLQELNDTLPVCDDAGNCTLPKYTDLKSSTTNNGTNGKPIITSFQLDQASMDQDLYVEARGPMAIVIPRDTSVTFNNHHDLIIDDNFPVYIFISKGATLTMKGGRLITDDYTGILGSDFTLHEVQSTSTSPYYPDVYVYGAQNSKYSSEQAAVATANFRAPLLEYVADNGKPYTQTVTYVQQTSMGKTTSTPVPESNRKSAGKEQTVAIIGQLIAGKITCGNNWNMFYVTLENSPTCTCPNAVPGGSCTGDPSTCTCGGCCASCICPPIVTPPPGPGTGSIPQHLYTMYYNFY